MIFRINDDSSGPILAGGEQIDFKLLAVVAQVESKHHSLSWA